jgi:hypothetical protein
VDETRRIAGGPTRKLGSSSFVADWAIERPSDASPPAWGVTLLLCQSSLSGVRFGDMREREIEAGSIHHHIGVGSARTDL